jgi:hypothetical protein
MREATWAGWAEPSYIPAGSIPLFGADVAHSPAREATRSRWDEPPAPACPRCGGATVDAAGRVVPNRAPRPVLDPATGAVLGHVDTDPVRRCADPVTDRGEAILEPIHLLCGLCHRSQYDLTPALARAVKVARGPAHPPEPARPAPAPAAPAPPPIGRVRAGKSRAKRAERAARLAALGKDHA